MFNYWLVPEAVWHHLLHTALRAMQSTEHVCESADLPLR